MVYKDWGGYEILKEGPFYQVKRIWIYPKCSISLQMHNHRKEHWLFIRGSGLMYADKNLMVVNEGDSVWVPIRSIHKVQCDEGAVALEAIETWVGDHLSEDDIERF